MAGSFDDVDRFAAEVRAEDAVRSRTQRSQLAQQAAEEATFAGVLVDLGERGCTVVLHLLAGRTVTGRVTQVGADFVRLAAEANREVLVALRAVGSVRTFASGAAAAGTQDRRGDLTLVEALGWLAEDLQAVHVRAGSAEAVAGELRAVGADVATVLLAGAPGGVAYLNLDEVTEVRLS